MEHDTKVADSPSNGSDRVHSHDNEKAHPPPGAVVGLQKQPGQDGVPENFRELDFMTRNGLNLRSFGRRKYTESLARNGGRPLTDCFHR